MTTQQLIENAKRLNAKISTEYENQIGIQFKSNRYDGLWHWFSVYKFQDGTESIMFTHSYSVNVGTTKKGTMHGIHVQQKLGFYEV